MGEYITVLGEAQAEYVEKRSRFIACARHCETEEEAVAFINEKRSQYWDARHNVFAYSVQKGSLCRFSDDGEPHGTAGKPMLDVIQGSGVTDVAIVVTRYFGGVLLGTGGLVRAYSKSSKDALENAKKARMVPCTVFEITCEYSDHARLLSLLENSGGCIQNTDFSDKININFYLQDTDISDFKEKLRETFSAKIEAKETENKVLPYEI